MRFTEAKTYEVEIVEAFLAAPKFSKEEGAFDVAVLVRDAEGHEDYWRGEISSEWGKGNFSDRTQAEITLLTLKNVGWQHGTDFSKIGELVGTKTTATVKERDGYYNISYIGSSGQKPQKLDDGEMKARLANVASFFPGQEQSRPEKPAPAAQKSAAADETSEGGGDNPFSF